jgi:hypothetical protein
MRKRGIVLSILFILSTFILINFISATTPVYSCSIVTRSACTPQNGGNIIMGVSNWTNAHGELASQGNYNYVICCYFGNGDTTDCTPSNKILGLSANTNAHAEVPGDNNYPVEVCYWTLQCISSTSGCNSNYYIPVVNLSDSTNAHLGVGMDLILPFVVKFRGYQQVQQIVN